MYLRRFYAFFISFTCSLLVDTKQKPNIMIALKVLAIACIAAVVIADDKPVAEIITEQTIINPDGYNFDFKTSDGVSRQETGELITVDDKVGIAIRGSYSYPGPDGQQYEVTFTADDKGYKPQLRVVPSNQ